jgi:hypothetical protein
MYNILHTASAPGLRDTLRPAPRRRRVLRRRRANEAADRRTASAPVLIPRP